MSNRCPSRACGALGSIGVLDMTDLIGGRPDRLPLTLRTEGFHITAAPNGGRFDRYPTAGPESNWVESDCFGGAAASTMEEGAGQRASRSGRNSFGLSS